MKFKKYEDQGLILLFFFFERNTVEILVLYTLYRGANRYEKYLKNVGD